MSRNQIPLGVDKLGAISSGGSGDADVKLIGTATTGLSTAIGRRVEFSLPEASLTFLLGCLAERDPDMFLRIADAIRLADATVANASANNQRMAWERKGGHSRQQLIRNAISNTITRQQP